jgi:hypothetical protein
MEDDYYYDITDITPITTTPADGAIGNPYDYAPTYVQVFDDGSTLETDAEGNIVRSTEATDYTAGSGFAGSISRLFDSIGQGAARALASAFKKPDGSTDWAKVASVGGGLYGLLNKGESPRPSGYQGGIPKYTATREMLTQPVTDPARVPGSAGRRYFSDVVYTPTAAATPPATTTTPPANPPAETATPPANTEPDTTNTAAQGGLMQLAKGRYLRGHTDGMEDKLRTTIDGKDPAALSHGEFVIPADVVSHLGNGNSDAGAKRLYQMMDRIRQARTGTKQQGKQINADKYLPS